MGGTSTLFRANHRAYGQLGNCQCTPGRPAGRKNKGRLNPKVADGLSSKRNVYLTPKRSVFLGGAGIHRTLASKAVNFAVFAGASREPIFDFTGLGFAIRPESIVGPQTFLLLHRGAALDEAKLTVGANGHLLVPFYNGVMLDDGAWLLLRIRRSEEYSGVREWFEDAKKLRGRIKSLVDDFEAGFLAKEDGLAQLKPSGTGDKTLLDEFFRLRGIINNDGVLSEREAGLYVGQLYTAILAAKKAISGDGSGQKPSKILTDVIDSTSKALSRGQRIDGAIGKAFEEQVTSVAKLRSFSVVRDTDPDRIANLSGDEVFKTMQYVPKALERSLKFQ